MAVDSDNSVNITRMIAVSVVSGDCEVGTGNWLLFFNCYCLGVILRMTVQQRLLFCEQLRVFLDQFIDQMIGQ